MTFLHGYLLGGLLLAGIPVALHLLLRQKPKRLPFPAFRFLKAKRITNSRRLQLQHLLLLLLRVLVIAALCLALSRPKLFSHRLGLGGDRPVVAALVVDTSASMEYAVAGVSRLDDAKGRVRELLDKMSPDSRVALVDPGDDSQPAFASLGETRSRLDRLRIRHEVGTLQPAVDRALRLAEQEPAEDTQPRLVYVFSDRTRASWDARAISPKVPDGVGVLFVDVGVDTPRDLGIVGVEVVPPVVAPGGRYEVRVTLRGTPTGHENQLSCTVDRDPVTAVAPVQMAEGISTQTATFDRVAPAIPAGAGGEFACQVTVKLAAKDNLAVNNTRHATFVVRGGVKLLTLVDSPNPQTTQVWDAVLATRRIFANETKTFAEADRLAPEELASYPVVALFQVSTVPDQWWRKLAAHVAAGGGLAVVPGGEEVDAGRDAFNKAGLAAGLLPAPVGPLATVGDGGRLLWRRFSGSHPLMRPFVEWSRNVDPDFARDDIRPFVRRYRQLGEFAKGGSAVAAYADEAGTPALAEKGLGKGRIVLFTSPLDFRDVPGRKNVAWNNYWIDSSFGLILIDLVTRYLAGETAPPVVNFPCGVAPQLSVGTAPALPLIVAGPGLSGAERNLRPPADGVVTAQQATAPGNYRVIDAKERTVAAFSVDLTPAESDLARVPVEEMEAVFGKDGVVAVGQALSLEEAIASNRPMPLELLPAFMLLLLLALTFEGLLANRFYRRPAESESPATPASPAAEGVPTP